jgi:hypothetical protein
MFRILSSAFEQSKVQEGGQPPPLGSSFVNLSLHQVHIRGKIFVVVYGVCAFALEHLENIDEL